MTDSSFLAHGFRLACLSTALIVGPALHCGAQIRSQPSYPNAKPQPSTEDVWEKQQRKEMEKKANLQRQQELKKDTDRLLELATELKQAVDKTDENTLSVVVVKRAEQIEKLAKSVKEKMKGP